MRDTFGKVAASTSVMVAEREALLSRERLYAELGETREQRRDAIAALTEQIERRQAWLGMATELVVETRGGGLEAEAARLSAGGLNVNKIARELGVSWEAAYRLLHGRRYTGRGEEKPRRRVKGAPPRDPGVAARREAQIAEARRLKEGGASNIEIAKALDMGRLSVPHLLRGSMGAVKYSGAQKDAAARAMLLGAGPSQAARAAGISMDVAVRIARNLGFLPNPDRSASMKAARARHKAARAERDAARRADAQAAQ